MNTPLTKGPRYGSVQCLAPLDPLPEGEPESRIAALGRWLDLLAGCVANAEVLKLFLAPASFLASHRHPLTLARYQALTLSLREQFATPRFRHWLIVPGSCHYLRPPLHLHGANLFLGGTRISSHVLQQRPPRSRRGPGLAVAAPPSPAPACHPACRVDDFRPETGLRLALEVADDHRDGVLWSAFCDAGEALPDLQLVTDSGTGLLDANQRILANTCAVRSGGLLFAAGVAQVQGASAGQALLLRHQGRGLYAPIRPELLLTVCGAVARFPTQSL